MVDVAVSVSVSVSVAAVEGVCVAVAVVEATVAGKLREMERTRKDSNKEAAVVRPRP